MPPAYSGGKQKKKGSKKKSSKKKKSSSKKTSTATKGKTLEQVKKEAKKLGIPLSKDGKSKKKSALMTAINYRK